ncbi:hypothetical protein AWW67_13250 [Roseivirga seohaensis]|jgi:hypothetical protein|uniref:Uncharacterized protein n=2 Tax=Roseivirga seohaensis TaxID=1914963 RepID=A0A150XL03_9BACT|nr:hypothetical protein AWW67_13250 [Roseivirga seohaensis]
MTMKKMVSHWNDKAAALLAGRILSWQRKLANVLQGWEKRLSIKQKKRGLFLFCLLGASACFIPLYNGLYNTPAKALDRDPQIITSPPILPDIDGLQPDTLSLKKTNEKPQNKQYDEDTKK